MTSKPNLLFLGIDSLRAGHMSLYGYGHLTTPHIDRIASEGAAFDNAFSPSIPTTSGYASMLTGMDCFGTDVVALRHKGPLGDHVTTLAQVLEAEGYNTTCVGFQGNPASRSFQNYLQFEGWGSYAEGRSHKAENLNAVAIPELKRMAADKKPFFLFLRHMDPHAPYLPPGPFERIFYGGNEYDPENHTLDPVCAFKPFADFFRTWFPPGCTDKDYIIAQYDGALAYMDAAIQNIFAELRSLGLEQDTLVVITSDHGETLYEHDCYFDHHSIYDCVLRVPLVLRFPGRITAGQRHGDYCRLEDFMPTVLDLMGIESGIDFDGRSLIPLLQGNSRTQESEFYITECTWMRKHGWRTPEWKLIHALEPDMHFKPEVELYNLVRDPGETDNLAEREPETAAYLEARMQAHIKRREQETGRTNPMQTNLDWHGKGCGPFETSQQAYDTLYIGDPKTARKLQAREEEQAKGRKGD